jgi:hypothetical protein
MLIIPLAHYARSERVGTSPSRSQPLDCFRSTLALIDVTDLSRKHYAVCSIEHHERFAAPAILINKPYIAPMAVLHCLEMTRLQRYMRPW